MRSIGKNLVEVISEKNTKHQKEKPKETKPFSMWLLGSIMELRKMRIFTKKCLIINILK